MTASTTKSKSKDDVEKQGTDKRKKLANTTEQSLLENGH